MRRFRVAALTTVVLASALAGCSQAVPGTGTPPPDAATLVKDALDTLGTVETGFAMSLIVTSGERTAQITARTAGDSGTATLVIDGYRAEVRDVQGKGFFKASADFWREYAGVAPADAEAVTDRWVESGGTLDGLLVYTNQQAFVVSLRSLDSATYRLAGRSEANGAPVFRLTSGTGASVEVTTSDPPRPVEIAAGTLGTIALTYPTDEVTVTAPEDPLPYPG